MPASVGISMSPDPIPASTTLWQEKYSDDSENSVSVYVFLYVRHLSGDQPPMRQGFGSLVQNGIARVAAASAIRKQWGGV